MWQIVLSIRAELKTTDMRANTMPSDNEAISRLLKDHDADRQAKERAYTQRKEREDAFLEVFHDRLANVIMPALDGVESRFSLPDYITIKARKGSYEGELSISIKPSSYDNSPLPETKRMKFAAEPGRNRVYIATETSTSSLTYIKVEDITEERVEDEIHKFLKTVLEPKR